VQLRHGSLIIFRMREPTWDLQERQEGRAEPVLTDTIHMPSVFLQRNSSARSSLITYRSVGISLRCCSGLVSAPESLRTKLKRKKGERGKEGNRALPVARGKLYTPVGYLLTVNTTAALRALCALIADKWTRNHRYYCNFPVGPRSRGGSRRHRLKRRGG